MKMHFWIVLAISIAFPAYAAEVRSLREMSTIDFSGGGEKIAQASQIHLKSDGITNPARLYPPSCISHPLPTSPQGPGLAILGRLRDYSTGATINVNLGFWRVPCSASKSALLLTMSVAAGNVLIPQFFIRQDGKEWLARLSYEPNTRQSFALVHLGQRVTTYAVEIGEGAFQAQGLPDLNRSFTIRGEYPEGIIMSEALVPAYSSADYTNVPSLLPLSGRLTGAYFQPGRGGEGILLEVAEAGATSLVVVSWYTFDAEGFPFWLVGSGVFTPGATSITVQLAGKARGGFGGQFDPAQLQDLPWGSITLRFPNCNTLDFSFASNHSIQGLPTGSGNRSWTRLTSVNGFACE